MFGMQDRDRGTRPARTAETQRAPGGTQSRRTDGSQRSAHAGSARLRAVRHFSFPPLRPLGALCVSAVRAGWAEALAWAALVVGIRLAYAAYSQVSYDDAYISLRYATNLAAGHGLVFNPGERVFGASTPLYVLLLALFARVGLPMPLFSCPAALGWAKVLSVLADGATAAIWYRLLSRETGSRWPG